MSHFLRKFFLLVFGVLAGLSGDRLLAQPLSIEGTVSDSATGELLQGASIYAAPHLGAITDARGSFALILPDSIRQIRVSYVGYQTRILNLSQMRQIGTKPVHLNIRMTASGFLEPVVISASKQKQREVETTVSMSSIQPYLIRNRINTTMEQTITQIPGVSSTDGQANIRSGSGWSYGTGSRVSILVDGMPMLSASSGQAHWSFFPLENVDQVEVIKGSASVLYGSSALNGVIHIRTQWPGNRELISASLFSGVYDNPRNKNWRWQGSRTLARNGAHVLYGKGSDRFQYVVSMYALNDDRWRMGDSDKRLRLSFKTRFFSKDKKLKVGLSGNLQRARTGSFLLWESYEYAYTILDSSYSLNNSTRANLDPSLEYSGTYFDHYLQTRYYLADNRIDPLEGQPDQANKSELYYQEYRARFKALEKEGLVLNLGMVNQYGEGQATMFQGKKVSQNHAAYLQADYNRGRWNLSAGARYEYFRLEQYTEAKPVFKAGMNFRAAKATYLRASVGQGYRFPVISEAFIRTSAGPVSIYPNPDLLSETGYTAEIGIRQGLGNPEKLGVLLDLAFYRMEFRNMMEFTFAQWGTFNDPLFGLGFMSRNIGPSRIQGFELTATGGGKWRALDIRFLAGYTYADPVNLDPDYVYADANGYPYTYKLTSTDTTGKILKYRNRHLIKTDLQLEGKRLGGGFSYRYTSRFEAIDRSFVDPPLNTVLTGIAESMEANKAGSHVVDVRTWYRITADVKATLTVNNIFNTEILSRPADIRSPRYFTLQLSYRY